ncbi:unnamed protein product [Arabidopsis thaliana]|uniref:F-box domain-containing protein n=1 Tax=Arabidopsis thaliana TaxID=3702 RepID=A0A5S9X3C8_ARATH|nr:unnamed protein product [Arabidopsis thaliana]
MKKSKSSPPRNLDDSGNSTKTISFDLTFEILSILPTKSIIRFQSVSKLWFSIIRSKEFVDSFLTRSKTRPRLLFTFKHLDSDKLFIYSAPDHDNGKSSPGIARHDMTISNFVNYIRSPPVNGFVCCTRGSSIAVCNPTTRQIVKLPDVVTNENYMHVRLGYDPVEDQYKVLLVVMMFDGYRTDTDQEYFVFTLSSQQKEWRKIENTTGETYHMVYGGICIDGAIYYGVSQSIIVKFDVRSEKMEFIQAHEVSHIAPPYYSTLLYLSSDMIRMENHSNEEVRFWILEDAEKLRVSHMACDVWDDSLGKYVRAKEEIHTGKLMGIYPRLQSSKYKPFSVCFYHFNKVRLKKTEIRGSNDDDIRFRCGIGMRTHEILSFGGYIENIRFL